MMSIERDSETQQKDFHPLYHEAVRRASQPQPFTVHSRPRGILLTMPNNVIFELIHTIVRETALKQSMSYIESELEHYLESTWDTKTTQRVIMRLRRDQAIELRVDPPSDLPLICKLIKKSSPELDNRRSLSPNSKSSGKVKSDSSRKSVNQRTMIKQVYDHIIWRIKSGRVTQITSLIVKLALEDGYKRGKLKVQLYDDVKHNFQDWRSNKLIKLYAFGNAPPQDQKLMLSSTNQGDLTPWIANYVDGSEKRQNPDLIRKLASALRDRTKNCIFITHDIDDAIRSIETGALRCAFLLNRDFIFEPLESNAALQSQPTKDLIASGKLYVINSLDCVEFIPDPTIPTCC